MHGALHSMEEENEVGLQRARQTQTRSEIRKRLCNTRLPRGMTGSFVALLLSLVSLGSMCIHFSC